LIFLRRFHTIRYGSDSILCLAEAKEKLAVAYYDNNKNFGVHSIILMLLGDKQPEYLGTYEKVAE
jgi:hypothetical protein